MTKVVKVGGVLLENPAQAVDAIRRVATERTAVVHGGGVQITRMLERMLAVRERDFGIAKEP